MSEFGFSGKYQITAGGCGTCQAAAVANACANISGGEHSINSFSPSTMNLNRESSRGYAK